MEAKTRSLSEKGRELYYKLKPKLERKYRKEDDVCFEVESGDYFVGKSGLAAIEKARQKYPDKKFFLAQVGRLAGILK